MKQVLFVLMTAFVLSSCGKENDVKDPQVLVDVVLQINPLEEMCLNGSTKGGSLGEWETPLPDEVVIYYKLAGKAYSTSSSVVYKKGEINKITIPGVPEGEYDLNLLSGTSAGGADIVYSGVCIQSRSINSRHVYISNTELVVSKDNSTSDVTITMERPISVFRVVGPVDFQHEDYVCYSSVSSWHQIDINGEKSDNTYYYTPDISANSEEFESSNVFFIPKTSAKFSFKNYSEEHSEVYSKFAKTMDVKPNTMYVLDVQNPQNGVGLLPEFDLDFDETVNF